MKSAVNCPVWADDFCFIGGEQRWIDPNLI